MEGIIFLTFFSAFSLLFNPLRNVAVQTYCIFVAVWSFNRLLSVLNVTDAGMIQLVH